MTTKPLPTEQPERGPWAWRDYLPKNLKELGELRRRTMEAADAGEISDTVADRFIGWAWAEMEGVRIRGGNTTESRYRRMLAELSPKSPPPLKSRNAAARRSAAAGRSTAAAATKGRAVAAIAAGRRTAASAVPKKGRKQPPRIPETESYVESPLRVAA